MRALTYYAARYLLYRFDAIILPIRYSSYAGIYAIEMISFEALPDYYWLKHWLPASHMGREKPCFCASLTLICLATPCHIYDFRPASASPAPVARYRILLHMARDDAAMTPRHILDFAIIA